MNTPQAPHTTEAHTPTPWIFEQSYSKSVHGSQCVGFIVDGKTNIADVVASYNITDAEALANAAHIVHCVNSFDVLTEANKKMREAISGAASSVTDERLAELKYWLDRKWNRHQEQEDIEAGNALCELMSIRKLAKAQS